MSRGSLGPEDIELIKRHFVAVAISTGHLNAQRDAEGKFIRDIGGPFTGIGVRICATAGGRRLGGYVREALENWRGLPPEERRPGAVQVEHPVEIDWENAEPQPPPGCLILKLYYRNLTRTAAGELVPATKADYPHWPKPPAAGKDYALEPQPGFLWVAEEEWTELRPAEKPRKGQRIAFPEALLTRILRQYFDPAMVFGQGGALPIRSAELALVVESVSEERVEMRLKGFARLGEEHDPQLKVVDDGLPRNIGYEPQFHGRAIWDRKEQKFIHFSALAIGDTYGKLSGAAFDVYRPGRNPLAIAFDLCAGETPADRVQ